jgi:hypothetical protein
VKYPDGDGQRLPGDVEMRIQLQKDARDSGDLARNAAQEDDCCDPGPESPGISPVSEECLAAVEAELCEEDHCTPQQRAMAENVARRRADHEIITELRARNFEGPLYDYFIAEQAAYALAVLMSWMRTGEIFRKCKEKGRPVRSTEIWKWDREDRIGLAHLAVTKALAVFRGRVLVPGAWDPQRGATIKTFFVGACLLQFANFFNECAGERRRWGGPALLGVVDDDTCGDLLAEDATGQDPATVVATRDRFRRALTEMPADLTKAAKMIYEGYTYDEAAAAIGINADALSARLRRFRDRHGKGGRG